VHVLIVTQYFWPESFRINDLAVALRERGHTVSVYTGLPNYPGGRLFDGYSFGGPYTQDYEGVRVVRVPLIPRGPGGPVRLALNYTSYAFMAAMLAPFRCPRDPDVVLVFEPSPVTIGIPARLIRRVRKAPLVFWVQDLWPESLEATGAVRSRTLLRSVDRLVRWIYRGCDLVLVQSRAFIAPIIAQGVEPMRVRYFPNSAESFYVPVVLPADAPERRELPPGFKVMFAGNLGSAQDFPTILAAAELLRDDDRIQWVIVGDGRIKGWVESEIVRRGLEGRVHLLGQRPPQDMPRLFSLADVLLVTLRREPIFAQTVPSKVQSYLACGKPIIAALEGEGAKIVEEAGAGFAVPPEDPRALADAIRSTAGLAPATLARMGETGLAYFRAHFARDRLVGQLETWLAELAIAQPRSG
jgi:glycosyltransferase involved in cell wall biosynthesis